jgi:FKBP-type peptidyl-prolyl cis-trans isomerase FkpA
MKTIKHFLLIMICAALVTGCKNASYRKTAGGMPYKVYKGKDTQRIKVGDFVKVHLIQKIKDSVYYTTAGKLPIYLPVTSTPQPYDIAEVWTNLRVGDSVITTQMMDTFITRSPMNVPPQFKKGDKIVTYAKVIGVFPNDSLARLDDEKTRKALLAQEITEVEKFLADKKITAQKTPSGAYIQIINPGTGNPIDSGNYITVNYTGATFAGVKFDSNTDTSFHHTEPLPFVAGTGGMIKGFDEAVMFLKKGGVAKVYIPSLLAYGANSGSPLIKPYEHLVFDVEVKTVDEKMPTRPDMGAVPPTQPQKVDVPQPKK